MVCMWDSAGRHCLMSSSRVSHRPGGISGPLRLLTYHLTVTAVAAATAAASGSAYLYSGVQPSASA